MRTLLMVSVLAACVDHAAPEDPTVRDERLVFWTAVCSCYPADTNVAYCAKTRVDADCSQQYDCAQLVDPAVYEQLQTCAEQWQCSAPFTCQM